MLALFKKAQDDLHLTRDSRLTRRHPLDTAQDCFDRAIVAEIAESDR